MKRHFFLFPLFTIILLTSVGFSYAQTVNENHEEPDLGDIIPEDPTVGPVGIVNELEHGHSIITDIMLTTSASISNEEYVDEEIFYEAVYVDYENDKLVVWLDPAQMFDPVAEDDITEDLGLLIPIEIKYGIFIEESAPSEATACPAESDSLLCYYWGRYVDRCLPERTTSRCTTYTTLITSYGYAVPTLLDGTVPDFDNDGIGDNVDQCITQPETINGYQDTDGCPDTVPITPVSTTVPTGSVIFSDDFENGLDKWTESGQREWQTGIPDDNRYIPDYPSSNLVAEADDCDDEACILTLDTAIDLTKYSSATLELWRFVDAGLDRNEYLSIQLGNNGAYTEIFHWTHGSGDDHLWHKETYNLSSYLSSASFTIRILTEQSKSSEDVAVDKINIIGEAKEDVSECTLNVTAQLQGDDILVSWNDCGEDIRRYKVYPVDNDHRSGYSSVYSGTSYTYTRGQEGHTYSFDVRAQYDSSRSYYQTGYFHSNQVTIPESDRTAPIISTPGNLSVNANSDGSITVPYSVTAYDTVDGTIPVNCSPPSGSMFAVGDTTVTCTASDVAGNSASKSFTVTVIAPAVDTDGDGYPDRVDNCPDEASSTNNGCPEQSCPVGGSVGGQSGDCPESTPTDSDMSGDDTSPCEEGTIFKGNYCEPNPLILDVYAGIKHIHDYTYLKDRNPTQPSQIFEGTIGFVGTNNDGEMGFIGAAHTFEGEPEPDVSPNIQTHDHQIEWSTTNFDGNPVSNDKTISNEAPITESLKTWDHVIVDAAWVKLDPDLATVTNQILRHDGQKWDIVHGSEADIARGDRIDMSGMMTNSQGHMLFLNATIMIHTLGSHSVTLEDYYVGNFTSVLGDSGAPITTSGSDKKLIGIHTGTLCEFNSPTEDNTMIHVNSLLNGYRSCGKTLEQFNADNPDEQSVYNPLSNYYRVIIPWEIIKSEFQLN